MLPDSQRAFQRTLALGPDFCPPELFAGPVDRILLGLKAHANTINHARHVALEDSYPKLRALIGAEEFHAIAERHLADPAVLGRSLDLLGAGLAERMEDGGARDVARIEWAWLESYAAAEAEALTIEHLLTLSPENVAELPVANHPATRFVIHAADEGATLITRPEAEVRLTFIAGASAELLGQPGPRALGGLLAAIQPDAVLAMIAAGAFTLPGEMP